MNNPKNPSANVLKNLELLYHTLSTCCSIFSLQIVDFVATPVKLKILQDALTVFGTVSACHAMRTIDYVTAEKIFDLCCSVKEQADSEYGSQSSAVAKRCEDLALEIFNDVLIDFEIASDAPYQLPEQICKTAKFCDFLGCAGNCNRSVSGD